MLTHVVGERVYDFSHVVGERDLGLVVGVAIGSMDTVYVLGRPKEVIEGVPKVSRLTIGMTPGDEELVARFGQYGDGDGQYIWLVGIALGSEENVYVTDEWLHRVVVFDGTGEYLASWGAAGEGDAEFNRPAGIAVDANDNLVVVDSLNHRVQKLTRDGGFLANWGGYGHGDGELDSP